MIAHVMTTDTARPGGVVRRPEHRPSFRLPSGTKSKPILFYDCLVEADVVWPRFEGTISKSLHHPPTAIRKTVYYFLVLMWIQEK